MPRLAQRITDPAERLRFAQEQSRATWTPEQRAANARRREIYEAVGGLGGDYTGSTRGSWQDRLGVARGTSAMDTSVTEALKTHPKWREQRPPAPPIGPAQLGGGRPAPTGNVAGSQFRHGRLDRMKRRFGGVTRAPGVQVGAAGPPMGGITQA